MSSPVANEAYDDAYVTTNNIDLGSSTKRAIAPYVTSENSWDYMQAGESNNFSSGSGYSVKLNTSGNISFTGTMQVDDSGVDVELSNEGSRLNLLGNPYTSFITSSIFLANETAISDTQTLWVWNQSTGTYQVKTLLDEFVLAPAQGFFVRANTTAGTFNFAESNQTVGGGTFQKTSNRTKVELILSDGSKFREATLNYTNNMTTGFDVGYEGELFDGVSNSFAIYTHLLSDREGINYQVQSLPNSDYENMIVPLGVNAVSGTNITIEASKNHFPVGIHLYLEDKNDNSFTLLNADSKYTTTLETDLEGIGRYYLHATKSVLNTNDFRITNNISIYCSSRENLRIIGVQNGTAEIQLYDVLGKEVLRNSFKGKGLNDISISKLTKGVYILRLTSGVGIINRKISIQ